MIWLLSFIRNMKRLNNGGTVLEIPEKDIFVFMSPIAATLSDIFFSLILKKGPKKAPSELPSYPGGGVFVSQ